MKNQLPYIEELDSSQSLGEQHTPVEHAFSEKPADDDEPYNPATPVSSQESPSPTPLATEPDPGNDSDAASIGGQRNTMTSTQLRIVIPALSVCLFVSFIDQTSVSTATPAIAGDLNTGTATSWIGTSFLIASTAFQLINGRLSDIFGRKNLLLVSLCLMALGDLGCGFAQTDVQLFVLRAIAGIGGGGINSLVMIIVSDITTLQNRGKYQGKKFQTVVDDTVLTPFRRLVRCHHCFGKWRWTFYRRRCG